MEIRSPRISLKPHGRHHIMMTLLFTCHYCSTLKDGLGNLSICHSLLLILYCSTHTDRSTYPRTFISHRQAPLDQYYLP